MTALKVYYFPRTYLPTRKNYFWSPKSTPGRLTFTNIYDSVLLLAAIRHESKYLTWHWARCHEATLAWSVTSRLVTAAMCHASHGRSGRKPHDGGKNTPGIWRNVGWAGQVMTTLTELNLKLGISRSGLSIPQPRGWAGEHLLANLQHSLIIRNSAKLSMTESLACFLLLIWVTSREFRVESSKIDADLYS